MNASNFETQSTSKEEFEPNLKKVEMEMSIMVGIKRAANWIHDGLGKLTWGIVVRGISLVILLTIGTGMYLSMDSDIISEATSIATNEADTEYRFMDVEDELSVDDLLKYVYPEEAAKTSAKTTDTEYRFMDVEDELSVEELLTYVYPEEAPR